MEIGGYISKIVEPIRFDTGWTVTEATPIIRVQYDCYVGIKQKMTINRMLKKVNSFDKYWYNQKIL